MNARFWRKVAVKDNCWEWTAAQFHDGYGVFRDGTKLVRAHRFSYREHYGVGLKNLCVLHKCDNRLCVRPDHLFLGTKKDNSIDMVRKGRQAAGENVANAKLTKSKVVAIRRKYAAGLVTQRALGQEYNISQSHVSSIIRGEKWRFAEAVGP